MLADKAKVGEALKNKCSKLHELKDHKEVTDKLVASIEKRHGIPMKILLDTITLLQDPVDVSVETIFCIMEAFDKMEPSKSSQMLPKYFEPGEIEKYSKYKYDRKKLKFPLKFEATEITENQWIGRITAKELRTLAPLINYNPKTQRSLRRVTLNGIEIYTIFLNERALNEITISYLNNSYIPNTITLNIPEEVDFDYKEGTLTFKTLKNLDIIDGYHRYVAMSRAYESDPNFDYTMEVRWTAFSEDLARQFIWQEDQKTKMTKVEAAAYNQNDPGNQAIAMLNQVTGLKDIISINGNINAGIASEYLNALWFNKQHHNYTRKEIVEVKKIIERGLMDVLDINSEAFDKRWTSREIGALFLMIKQEDVEELFSFIDYINKIELPIHSVVTKREISRLEDAHSEFKR